MKILRLELQGFKSFRDKTIISFDQDITAIVGSNGCGKSNVVDALYWVMGDMSPKHLRGSTMVDVIFSGTKNFPAMDMAEVTMVLERDPETDAPLPPQFQAQLEVQVTRRYYRHGESEYFINSVPCRLRDIQEFFMDTGIGAKSYSIIEQGAITRMVQQKPEDRRRVIEDVAGIMKFKARRAETLRKLDHSKTNLQRIDDIVRDLQKQLNTLKRQSDKAEKFIELKKELKNLDLRVAGEQWKNTHSKSGSFSVEKTSLEELKSELSDEIIELEKKLISQEESLVEKVESVKVTSETRRNDELKVKDIESEIKNLQSKKENSESRLQEAKEGVLKLSERRQELSPKIDESNELIQSESEALAEIEKSYEDVERLLTEKKNEEKRIRAALKAEQDFFHQFELEQTKLTQEIQGLQNRIHKLKEKETLSQEGITSILSNLELRSQEKLSTDLLLEKAFSERKELEETKNSLEEQIHVVEEKRDQTRELLDDVTKKHTAQGLKLDHLESLEKNMEGVDPSIRKLALDLKEQGKEKILLADQIEVPSLLEKAVDVALGKGIQNIVLNSVEDALELQKTLSQADDSEAQAGRPSFFIKEIKNYFNVTEEDVQAALPQSESSETNVGGLLTQVSSVFKAEGPQVSTQRESELNQAKKLLLEEDYVVGPLNDLIAQEIQNKEFILNGYFKEYWVVKDRSNFAQVLRLFEGALPFHFVSLEGDLLTKEAFLEFAAVNADSQAFANSLTHRKNQIHELQESVEALTLTKEKLQSDFSEQDAEWSRLRAEYRGLTTQLVALNPDLERHSQFLRKVEAQLAALHEKDSFLKNEIQKSTEEVSSIDLELQEKTQSLTEKESEKNGYASKVKVLNTSLEDLLVKLSADEVELKAQRQKISAHKESLSRLQSEVSALKQELHLSEIREEQLLSDQENISVDLEELTEGFQKKEVDLDAQKEIFTQSLKKEEVAAAEADSFREELKQIQSSHSLKKEELSTLDKRALNIEQEVAVAQVEMTNLEQRIQEQYQMNFHELDEAAWKEVLYSDDIEEGLDLKVSAQRLEKIKKQIDKIGNINMLAAEEFKEISQRHEYLYIQRQDVGDSISRLEDALFQFDTESKTRFEESFHAVNNAFKETFPVLFGGGQAELRMTDPDNLLETGVEIVAQPPGKKLQSVTLLSGGEKALTAVSLIFGIFSIKPSPFAVLDEVDAPLDDTNVARFNKQVRKMSYQSQIIMITHQKKTMESSDAMYGVTMEQRGISKVASAKLGHNVRA